MDTVQVVWFSVLFAAIVAWFGLAARMFRLLRQNHREVYESLGSPSLLLNNSIRNGWLSLRFLMRGDYRDVNDDRVRKLGNVMRVFFVAYVLWFLGPIVFVLMRS